MNKEQRNEQAKATKKPITPCCDCCMYYDCDEDGDYYCMMDFEEDESARYMSGYLSHCPYFRFYDEYKSVAKQN